MIVAGGAAMNAPRSTWYVAGARFACFPIRSAGTAAPAISAPTRIFFHMAVAPEEPRSPQELRRSKGPVRALRPPGTTRECCYPSRSYRSLVTADGALTPPELDRTVIGVAGGNAGSGAPTRVRVRTPATSVKGPAPSGFGSNVTPVVVTYGFRNSSAFGSVVDAVTMRRCLPARYSTEAMLTTSGSGLTVTVVLVAAEVTPPLFLAVIERLTTSAGEPTSRVGAVNVTVAEARPVEVTFRFTRAAVPPAWVTENVTAWAGTFGSVAVTLKEPAAPANSVIGATGATVGACATSTVMVVLAEAVPQAPVTVRVAVTGGVAPAAENVVAAVLAGATLPLETVHAKLNGPVPAAVPERATVPPAATVKGPPTLTVAGVQTRAGIVLPGHGFSWPGITPVLEGYPPCARNGMVSKLFGTIGVPGTFSGKMYSIDGWRYWP